ncbi:peptidyl-prolyl cis-trans isomerase [Croceibacterium sp. LX-88]|uniref:Peptidyl-prolyl cis-trans isomerase n=1 Tax=Croceibacterium selenioxidans TaxID=2838833 RepID=A0ABS5W1I9_9SPHN|nr:peptidyl-prolyl cis-trans isomerase [Croceibacterium selenioxidans]MBT2133616.1 peptidyl-prolyl cis-trans isomerase [Croceibacterium selenioxidans]
MLQFFRNFFKSKIGVVVTLGFLALIALAFASSDVANTSVFGGVSGGDRVAVVGGQRINSADLKENLTAALERERQQQPTLTMQTFLSAGGLEATLKQLLQRTALAVFGEKHGMRAGDRLVDSQIVQIPAFQGAGGTFDENAFRAAIAQQGLSESMVRHDLGMGLLARQLITPITFSPVMPHSAVQQYASLLRERRHGTVALIPSAAFAPQGDPTDAQLQTFYGENRNNFVRPERRVIRYATFGEEALGARPAPTEAQIAARFKRDQAKFAPTERRTFTQVIVPTQAAANALVAEVQGGKPLDAAARAKGLATASIGPSTRAEFAASASPAVAQSAFATERGALAAPARGGLGWYVLRVDQIDHVAGRTLEQARAEITAELAEEQRRAAFLEKTASIEEELEGGRSLGEVAQELNLTLSTTPPATADGRLYGKPTETLPQALAPVLKVAFDMEEGQPQLAEIAPGQTFLIYEVSEITPSATAPLAEIKSDVIALWRRDEGSKAAKAASERVLQRLAQGTDLAAAVAAEKRAIPAPQPLNIDRQEMARIGNVPSSLALFFSMAAGTVKKLEAPQNEGWFIVKLDKIEAGAVPANDPILVQTLNQLGRITAEEYVEQFVNAAQDDVGVERNQTAIDAVVASLTGTQVD